LFEPARTQLDLNFSLFGIHVRVHPMFWVVTAILGSNQRDAKYVLLWIAVVFVSVLIHEMGHVLMGRIFGSDGHIVLYGFGGLAIGSNALEKRWQRIAVSFAGPLAQFLLLGLVFVADIGIGLGNQGQESKPIDFVFDQLIWVNLAWPILNLLPIWPLDGGMISREVFQGFAPETGTATSLIVSMIVPTGIPSFPFCAVACTWAFSLPCSPSTTFKNGKWCGTDRGIRGTMSPMHGEIDELARATRWRELAEAASMARDSDPAVVHPRRRLVGR
jgi:Zn-dependent protease